MSGPSAFDFRGRVVVITGAGGGIGRAHATLLASLGASVVVNDVGRDVHGEGEARSAADDVVAEIVASGGTAVASTHSIASAEGGRELVDLAVATYGRLDAVVHNAGILRDRSFTKMTPEDVEPVLDVHLRGGFHVALPAFPVMREQGYGRIVLTTSASGLFGTFGQANYGAAKTGLVGLMNVLSVEGERHGILVNCLSPTARTRMTEDLLGDLAEHFDPGHVAAVVAYLVSDRCTFTHRILTAGGGRVGRIFIGVTPGVYLGRDVATPDAVEARIDEILDVADGIVPENGLGEVELIRDALLGEP